MSSTTTNFFLHTREFSDDVIVRWGDKEWVCITHRERAHEPHRPLPRAMMLKWCDVEVACGTMQEMIELAEAHNAMRGIR